MRPVAEISAHDLFCACARAGGVCWGRQNWGLNNVWAPQILLRATQGMRAYTCMFVLGCVHMHF